MAVLTLLRDLPPCSVEGCKEKAHFIAVSKVTGTWANLCREHYERDKKYPTLGEGKAQMLITRRAVE